ncbi:MAG: HD domain-containing phosphohydrolase [Terriglobales bacterium]
MSLSPESARILIVDDEAPIREMLMDRLRLAGYGCRQADSAEHALEAWEQHPADLVITDLRMPGRSGLDLLARLRQMSSAAVILATAESDIHVAIDAMKQGAADYLLKPFQFEMVLAAIHRALEMARLEREVENYRLHLEQMVAQRTSELEAAMRHIEDTYDATLQALGAALDLRATEVAGHSLRVSLYTEEMARRMGMEGEALRNVIRGAYLHDIGKLGIPDAILLKSSGLTPQEKAVMESHVRIGFEMVQRIEFLAIAAEIVHNHQERFDGDGYPRGLRGEAIPLPARIFSVADALDAMTSNRPYRGALPFAVARGEIVRESGRQFDPKVVEVFLAVPEARWEELRDQVASARTAALNGTPRLAPQSAPAAAAAARA